MSGGCDGGCGEVVIKVKVVRYGVSNEVVVVVVVW